MTRIDEIRQRLEAATPGGWHNVAVKGTDGWVWWDRHGKDYGPYGSKHEAETRGPLAAKREEQMLSGRKG